MPGMSNVYGLTFQTDTCFCALLGPGAGRLAPFKRAGRASVAAHDARGYHRGMSVQIQQWQYMAVTISNDGKVGVTEPDGGVGVPPQHENFILLLNRFGKEGWELVQGA